MRIGCGYLFSKEKILSGAPRELLGGPKGRQDDGQHIFSKMSIVRATLWVFLVWNHRDRRQVYVFQ